MDSQFGENGPQTLGTAYISLLFVESYLTIEFFYPNLPSAIHPVPRSSEISITTSTEKLEDIPEGSEDEDQAYDDDFSGVSDSSEPQTYSQLEINDLVRDLGLPKDSTENLALD
ncbi:hypothetical protein AVEN_125740-1 [Araneus ventricosus]|uniref:Uncharacterized protein n=1 Tax=Araneus ventricosus TaxID=182803 RepID=A0A4Y2WJQ7_ARAVE|nr:hypothetical protein AVEN_250359-1 [Araneus ventricosus]GBO36192.1 hypothetical protein AVEN_9424-1 [Araneus ventricosus]GBO36195.1 hypothetical protein AVEN_48374-1 [Araneus ventricosus]GBO36197.1 hypothetical protein AVEN_125740-1 [Araneus ventricosus]